MSELALGWCTYNGDHMSMYNPNISIPKTLVKFLVRWAAENEFEGEARRILLDIVATEISPELLPAGADGKIAQATEGVIGPYELHDFFLFHFLRYGDAAGEDPLPGRAGRVSTGAYAPEELRHWLRGVRAALLRQPVQALVSAGRAQGRLDQPVAARRLAHAERRAGGLVAPVVGNERSARRAGGVSPLMTP